MNKMNNFMPVQQASNLNLRNIIFGQTGIGDQILLLAAAEQYYKKTSKKLLLACQYRELARNADFCWILDAPDSENVAKIYVEQSKTNKKHTGSMVTMDGTEFTLKFILAFDFKANKNGLLIRRLPGRHMLARLCERLGLSGEIEILSRIRLDDEEKHFGCLSEKRQITIMTGGQAPYKSFSPKTAQRIVDALHAEYDFVQIGGRGDPPLANTRHLMGKLPLRKTAAVLYHSALFVGAIGGLMHLAHAASCPSVIAFAGEPLAYEYYSANAYVFSDTPCAECPEGRLDPLYDPCPHAYRCAVNIDPDKMIAAIREKLSTDFGTLPPQTEMLRPDPVSGMELWHRYRYMLAQRMCKERRTQCISAGGSAIANEHP
jgi:hypothetical protein